MFCVCDFYFCWAAILFFLFSKLTSLHKLNPPRFYQKYRELQARIKANSCPVLPATPINNVVAGGGGVGSGNTTNNYIVQRSASLKDSRVHLRYFFVSNKYTYIQVFMITFTPVIHNNTFLFNHNFCNTLF